MSGLLLGVDHVIDCMDLHIGAPSYTRTYMSKQLLNHMFSSTGSYDKGVFFCQLQMLFFHLCFRFGKHSGDSCLFVQAIHFSTLCDP